MGNLFTTHNGPLSSQIKLLIIKLVESRSQTTWAKYLSNAALIGRTGSSQSQHTSREKMTADNQEFGQQRRQYRRSDILFFLCDVYFQSIIRV